MARKTTTAKKARKQSGRGTRKTAAKKGSRGAKSTSTPGISRVDQEATRTHGYVVRVDYRRTSTGWRPKHTAFFGDASHGGKGKALTAAQDWLKSLRKTGKPPKRR